MAAEKLIQNGCECILQLSGYSAIPSPALERHRVFEETCASMGVQCITYELSTNEFKRQTYYDTINALLEHHPKIDGLFSTDIIMAYASAACLTGVSGTGAGEGSGIRRD